MSHLTETNVKWPLHRWYNDQDDAVNSHQKIVDILAQDRFQTNYNPAQDSFSHLPDSSSIKQIEQAAKSFVEHLLAKNKIVIVGDYDVDGVTSVSLLSRFLKQIAFENYEVELPNRFKHGYGLSENIIPSILDKKPKLVITVDNGSSSYQAVEQLKEHQIEVIVTDHHQFEEKNKPDCILVNPQQADCSFPFKGLSGVGVAFYFLIETRKQMRKQPTAFPSIPNLASFLDLVALGTIADHMELIGINRILTKHGIDLMQKKQDGLFYLKAIKAKFSYQIVNSQFIAFQFAPLINAAGRVEDAKHAFDFIDADSDQSAQSALNALLNLNKKRKNIQKSMLDQSIEQCENEKESAIFVGHHQDNHEGISGIIAHNIVDIFNKPAIIFAHNQDVLKGSSRSPEHIDIIKLLTQCTDLIIKFGGHKNAAGLTIKQNDLEALKTKLNQIGIDQTTTNTAVQHCDMELTTALLDQRLIEQINCLEPFGYGNTKPFFLIKSVTANNIKPFGINKQHVQFRIDTHDCIFWNGADELNKKGFDFDIIFEIEEHQFQKRKSLRLNIKKIIETL